MLINDDGCEILTATAPLSPLTAERHQNSPHNGTVFSTRYTVTPSAG